MLKDLPKIKKQNKTKRKLHRRYYVHADCSCHQVNGVVSLLTNRNETTNLLVNVKFLFSLKSLKRLHSQLESTAVIFVDGPQPKRKIGRGRLVYAPRESRMYACRSCRGERRECVRRSEHYYLGRGRRERFVKIYFFFTW